MKIENWSLGTAAISLYQPPESNISVIRGIIYGDPRFTDGDFITTSLIVQFTNGKFITKSGSAYELGEVDPDYDYYFPHAKFRLIEALSAKC